MKNFKNWVTSFKGEKERVMTTLGNVKITKQSLEVEGSIRLDGQVVGNIFSSENIYIGKNSHVECNLDAKYVQVEGEVRGRITAKERIEILSGGRIFGDVFTPHLDVEGSFHGKCNVEKEAEEKIENAVEKKETEAAEGNRKSMEI
jgi:cytoskeletal protein CcmA (bactofilin family)